MEIGKHAGSCSECGFTLIADTDGSCPRCGTPKKDCLIPVEKS